MSWRVGDAIVLLAPVGLVHDEAALEELLSTLDDRRFLRSTPARVHGDLRAELMRLCTAHNCGCRVTTEEQLVDGAIITCARHAHLALSVVVERDRKFRADCIGIVTTEGIDIATYRTA